MLRHIDPDALTATTHDGFEWLNMAEYGAATFLISVGTLGSSATFNAIVQQASDSGGTGVKSVTVDNDGSTDLEITELTQAGTDESDQLVLLTVKYKDMDEPNDFTHVRLRITVGTATSDGGATVTRFRKTGELA